MQFPATSPKSASSAVSSTKAKGERAVTPSVKSPSTPNSAGGSSSGKKHYNLFGPYKLGKTIGQGEFGKVKIGNHLQSGNEVAIKLIKKDSITQPSRKQKLIREIEILQSVNHRNIVKLWEVIETDNYIGMIMSYAEGGELFDHILTRRYLKDAEACRLFSQLILAVSYLHGNGVVHRDLKLENLLLDKNRNLIVTDFGFANRFDRGSKEGDLLSTSCGSACYAAPELVINDKYNAEGADIWSCGVILFAMVCGYLPYDDDPSNKQGENINQLYKYIMETQLSFPSQVSLQAQHLILRILVTNPEKRAKMNEIQSHRWLSAYKKDFMSQQESLPRVSTTSVGRTKLALPETRSGRSSVQAKKASNPMLVSIQETSESPADKTATLSPSSATQSAGSSTGFAESPLSSALYSRPPPLSLPRPPSTPPVSAPVVASLPRPTNDEQNLVPSVTDANNKISYRKSTEFPVLKSGDEKEEDADTIQEAPRAVSMDQSRAGIVGITDGLDEEFKKLKGIDQVKQSSKRVSTKPPAPKSKEDDPLSQTARDFYLLKMHSGPIDRRALSTEGPHYIQKLLIEKLQEMEFELYLDPYDQFKIKAVQVQDASGNPIKASGKRTNVVKGIFDRIRYVGQFGLQYNRGYTGSTNLPPPPPSKRKQETMEPIKMSVMIHRIKNLDGILTLDVKRTRGDIWEFKRVYEDLIRKLNLSLS